MTLKKPITFSLFLLRLFSGFGGGVAGTLVAFVIYFLMLSVVPPGESSSLSVFTVMLIAFGATLTANTATVAMVGFMDGEKYHRQKTTLTHVFIFNLILFFLSLPVYVLGVSLDIVSAIAASHFMLSAFISSLIMEVLAGEQYMLLGIYSSSFGVFMSLAFALALTRGGASELLIILGAMPLVWFFLQLASGLGEWIYDTFIRLYGLNALDASTDLGGDNVPQEEMSEEE